MSPLPLNSRGALCQCQNCRFRCWQRDLNDLQDVLERVEPGDIMPAGECPECGAASHIVDRPHRTYVTDWQAGNSHWQDCPGFEPDDWKIEVGNDDTRLGYADWCLNQADIRDEDDENWPDPESYEDEDDNDAENQASES